MPGNLFLFCVLMSVGAVVFINGWTDAPTAIATCVCSGAMRERRAALLAAFCNLAGIALSFLISPAVAATVEDLVSLPTQGKNVGLSVLLCAMLATGLWAVAAWFFGIPTSESHGLLAGLSGAAVAYGGVTSLNSGAWLRVLFGLVLSIFGGILLGGISWGVLGACRREGKDAEDSMKRCLTVGAAVMALMHGAQDGQKFVGLWLLALTAFEKESPASTMTAIVICAALMGMGTLLGGGRIIRTLGEKLIKTGYGEGFAADVGAAACLLMLTLFGMPVSTTHTKTAALIGVGAAKGRGRLDVATALKLLGAWVLTFPACFGMGYFLMTVIW